MLNLKVNLKNPDIILMPITEEEATHFGSRSYGDESIYLLYKTSDSEDVIQIGMLSSSVSKSSPDLANLWRVKDSTDIAYFYSGCIGLEQMAFDITDRPVYRITPNDDRTVSRYTILNATVENGLNVSLDDLLAGKFVIDSEETMVEKRKGSM